MKDLRLTIGNVTLENNVILAPMAGVTDLPFRLLCREMGVGLVCMEMVSAKAIYYNNKNTEELLKVHPGELPASLQLFGSDPEILGAMAARIQDRPYSFIDLNMGCPVPKVVNNGEGSALMKNPRLAEKIFTSMVNSVKKPVTVKIRKGFDDDHVNAVEIAKIAEGCGVVVFAVEAAVFVVDADEAGFCCADCVVAGFETDVFCAGGGSSAAGGGIGCGSARFAVWAARQKQSEKVRSSSGRRNARDPASGNRRRFRCLPMRVSMPYAPGKVRMGFGSTKTAGRK